jgi:hypothetical protein
VIGDRVMVAALVVGALAAALIATSLLRLAGWGCAP